MIIGDENIYRWIQQQRTPFWKLYRRGSDEIIAQHWYTKGDDTNQGKTVDEGVAALADTFSLLSPGVYHIRINSNPNDGKNDRESDINHTTETANGVAGVGTLDATPPEPAMDIKAEIQKGVAAELERRKKEEEIEQMAAELKEYKRKDSAYHDAVKSAIGQIMPFVQAHGEEFICGIINALNGNKAAAPVARIAGTQKKNDMNELNDDAKRLENVIGQLRAIEPTEWLNLLEALVNIHTTDPATYTMARNFLLK